MQRGTNLGRLGGFNQAVVLEAIRFHPDGISRVELAEATGLSPQTISNVARRLLDGGWIRESGTIISGPGKPRTILELIPDRYVTVGVHVDPSQMMSVLVDLNGKVLNKRFVITEETASAEETVNIIGDEVEALIEESGYEHSDVLGLGVAAPGPVDLAKGTVVNPPLLNGWDEVNLVDPLTERLNLEVVLSKDTVAATSAEQWLGQGAGLRDFLCVYVGVGVGIGLVLDGSVMQGQTGNTGELGHVNTGCVRDRECPVCGRNDCLAINLNYATIVDRARAAGVELPGGPDSSASNQLRAAQQFFELAKNGDPAAQEIGLDLADMVARSVGQVASLLDVDQVVVCGPVWNNLREFAEKPVSDVISTSFHGTLPRPMTVKSSDLGSWTGSIGAACVVLDELVSPKTSGLLLV